MAKYSTPSAKNKKKFAEASKMAKRATEGENDFLSKISTTAKAANKRDRRRSKEMFESIPKDQLDMMRMPDSFSCGGMAHKKPKKMASGGMPKAKKGRRGDGICSRGRTKGRMV